MTNVDLRTPTQKARAEKHNAICNMYLELKNNNPEVSNNRIFTIVGQKFGNMAPATIRYICINNGVFMK